MALKIITSDEQLRKYIPNLFATAQGETPFYDRLLPWLETAERWLFSQFVGDGYADTFLTLDENDPVRLTAACVVVHEAMMRAVPSLDLVLTPNGFGIVSNQNVAPASRDRVARLIASLEASRDDCIKQLVAYLFRITEWYGTTIRRWFTATLFPFIDLANLCGFTDHRWSNYLGLRTKAIDIEHRIAEEYVSPEQMNVFRDETFAMSWDFSCEPSAMPNPFEHCQGDAENGGEHFSLTQRSHAQVIERLRSVVVAALQGNALNVPSLCDIVDFMRKHEDQFPEFRASRTYKLFEPPIFENKKKNSGYFF